MMKTTYSLALYLAVAVLLSGCRLRESEPQIHGTQPELRIEITPDLSATDISNIVHAATEYWPPSDHFWPQPERLYDADSDWVVWFKRKEMYVMRAGERFIIRTRPNGQGVLVNKTNFTCRLMSSR